MVVTAQNHAFSVAVATYNRAQVIGETLRHILGQTHQPREVVVVDDGSSDATADAVRGLADSRIRYHSIDNVGPGGALKAAIELCSCPWIAMCDDDDVWRPNHLERRARLLSRYPDIDFAFSDFTAFGSAAVPDYSHFATIPRVWWDSFDPPDSDGYQLLGREAFPKFLTDNPVFPFTACFSRDLWERSGGIDDKFSWFGCWDAHLTWKLALHGNTVADHQITAERREHQTNFSKRRSQVNLERASMLETVWADGWIPARYKDLIDEQIAISRERAASWAWHDHDYRMLRRVTRTLPMHQWRGNWLRYLVASYLPPVLTNKLRRALSN